MSFGLKKGGKIKGKGTGTSDSIQAEVPEGSYIMPADSTQAIGEQNLDQMGDSIPVNVSNGEFGLTPKQVHAVGVQTLDQMKDATHTPVDQPQVQAQQGEKPPLFFANGGLVSAYPSADEIRRARQPQLGGPQMRDVTPQTRQLPTPSGPSTRAAQAATQTPTTANAAPSMGSRLAGAAKGLGAMHGIGAMAGGAVQGMGTSTDQYAQRLGLDPKAERGNMADLGIRAAGVMSDVGNAASFGLLGNRFADKQVAQAQSDADANMADILKRRAERDATTPKSAVSTPQQPENTPSINQQMNDALYAQPKAAQAGAADPYAIRQQGNSFSYANPNAAAAARSQGVPELSASGIQGKANDPVGVANMMANTREMGASQEQINAALQQNSQGGFGMRYPDRPQITEQQEAERKQIMSDIRAPIKGARGMTANQRAQLMEMNQNDLNRGNDLYNTDANNSTSSQNNAANNAASIVQTGMREDGQNLRHGASLNQDGQQFNAEFGLKSRQQNLTETKEGFGIRQAEKVEKLHEMYDKAKTDEQRQSILERINRLSGKDNKAVQGKDRFMTVGGGQEWDDYAKTMVNRPQQIFDTVSGQMLNMGAPNGAATQDNPFADYQVVEDANGNRAYLKDGKYLPIP